MNMRDYIRLVESGDPLARIIEFLAADQASSDEPSGRERDHASRRQLRIVDGIIHTGWLVHFTYDPTIVQRGFRGVANVAALGLTSHRNNEKVPGGYNFAFQVESKDAAREAVRMETKHSSPYGDWAVVFRARYVLVDHKNDRQRQAIFLGSDFDQQHAASLRVIDNSTTAYWDGRYKIRHERDSLTPEQLALARRNARQPMVLWSVMHGDQTVFTGAWRQAYLHAINQIAA